VQSADHHFGYLGLAKKHRATLGIVQQSIHNNESLARCQVCRPENTAWRKASVQAESHESPLALRIPMWKATLRSVHLTRSSSRSAIVSADFVKLRAGRKPGGRPEGLPHYEHF
jgi:hypothetical protein